ncbi:unnamed protein product [Arctogadus glacialis]
MATDEPEIAHALEGQGEAYASLHSYSESLRQDSAWLWVWPTRRGLVYSLGLVFVVDWVWVWSTSLPESGLPRGLGLGLVYVVDSAWVVSTAWV